MGQSPENTTPGQRCAKDTVVEPRMRDGITECRLGSKGADNGSNGTQDWNVTVNAKIFRARKKYATREVRNT